MSVPIAQQILNVATRRDNAPPQIDNASLPAGADMFYYCKGCRVEVARLPEAWVDNLPPHFCDDCKEVVDAGYMDRNGNLQSPA